MLIFPFFPDPLTQPRNTQPNTRPDPTPNTQHPNTTHHPTPTRRRGGATAGRMGDELPQKVRGGSRPGREEGPTPNWRGWSVNRRQSGVRQTTTEGEGGGDPPLLMLNTRQSAGLASWDALWAPSTPQATISECLRVLAKNDGNTVRTVKISSTAPRLRHWTVGKKLDPVCEDKKCCDWATRDLSLWAQWSTKLFGGFVGRRRPGAKSLWNLVTPIVQTCPSMSDRPPGLGDPAALLSGTLRHLFRLQSLVLPKQFAS